MDDLKVRELFWVHVVVTLPAIMAVPAVLLLRNYLFFFPAWPIFPALPYYLATGAGLGYQWYAAAIPRWKEALRRKGIPEDQVENAVRRSGLVLPGAPAVGLFALHTAAAALCATSLGPWLAGRCVHWGLPLIGVLNPPNAMDFYLQNFAVATTFPALVVGYVICRKFSKFASWAWLLPAVVIAFKLVTFSEPNPSVLVAGDPWHRFAYYFAIQRFWPTFYDARGSDPERVLEQVYIVGTLYSSIAYSVGALAEKRHILDRVVESLRRNHGLEHPPAGTIVEHPEEETYSRQSSGASAIESFMHGSESQPRS